MKLSKSMAKVLTELLGTKTCPGGEALVLKDSREHQVAKELARHGLVQIDVHSSTYEILLSVRPFSR